MHSLSSDYEKEEALYLLSELRTAFAFDRALSGFDMDEETALRLLRDMNDEILNEQEREQKNRLIVALANIIEFATCEEYQMMNDIENVDPDINLGTDWWDSTDMDFMEPYLAINQKYNETYADVEDGDIEYSMAMAAAWIKWDKDTVITYMTQDDDRVRPWHHVLHGFSAHKDEFPAWLIPPIEWACRCYLISDAGFNARGNFSQIKAKVANIEKPKELDGVFKESVCKCGRIFSEEHPYFQVKEGDKPMLDRIVGRLRNKYYGME